MIPCTAPLLTSGVNGLYVALLSIEYLYCVKGAPTEGGVQLIVALRLPGVADRAVGAVGATLGLTDTVFEAVKLAPMLFTAFIAIV
jgi:hypothetical protein